MHYERVSLARRGGSWRMSYRAVYDAEHKLSLIHISEPTRRS